MTCGCAATAWWTRRTSRRRAGKPLNLTAVIAPDPRAAAQYYPAGYWLSLIHVPEKSEFPGHRRQRHRAGHEDTGGLAADDEVGDLPGVPRARHEGDPRDSRGARRDVPDRRLEAADQLRPGRRDMMRRHDLARHGAGGRHVLRLDRLVSPRGKSRRRRRGRRASSATIVITEWDWADPKAYLHDEVSTDRRNPRAEPRTD